MPTLDPLLEATNGALGAVFANTIVFPLDVAKVRLQVQNQTHQETYTSAVDAIKKIYAKEGLAGLYSGLGSGLLGTIVSSFSYFYIYSNIRKKYLSTATGKPSTAIELLLGAVAGALTQFVVLPINVLNTRQQTDPDSTSLKDAIGHIIQENGIQGFWKGLKASLVLCSNPAITYGLFERLKSEFKRDLTAREAFLMGALSKALATIITYPYIMAKVRLQWRVPKDIDPTHVENVTYSSSLDVLRKVYATDGIFGIYQGMQAQILKAVLCQAILFGSKEKLTQLLLALKR